jgi:hypothetical protein
MNMMMTTSQDISRLRFVETSCPYDGNTTCRASLTAMAIDEHQRQRWCATDDYDSCPMFLSKVLRRS